MTWRKPGPGRPRTFAEPLSGRVVLRLTPAQRADLLAVAAEQGCKLTEVIRDAVNEYVQDYRERAIFAVAVDAEKE